MVTSWFQAVECRGIIVCLIPTISVLVPVPVRDFSIIPGHLPIPYRLLTNMMGQFVELADLLPDNLKANEIEMQMFLDYKLVVAPGQK